MIIYGNAKDVWELQQGIKIGLFTINEATLQLRQSLLHVKEFWQDEDYFEIESCMLQVMHLLDSYMDDFGELYSLLEKYRNILSEDRNVSYVSAGRVSSDNTNQSNGQMSGDCVSGYGDIQVDGVKDITSSYYSVSQEVAKKSPHNGRFFTDHKEAHVEMVAQKSQEAGAAIQQSIEAGGLQGENDDKRVAFSSNIDYSTLKGAALSHDTGMQGNGYALGDKKEDGTYEVHREDNNNFNEIRSNHSLNSAINVLVNRENYKSLGYSDQQVDKMAVECMAHSKSSSGVKDLNSRKDWIDCFNRIQSTMDAYKADHPNAHIIFNRASLENNDKILSSIASETLALRIGDVSRDSHAGAEAQAGENVYVDRNTINNHSGSIEKELENANIRIGEKGDIVDSLKSRQVHTGEQNIVKNHTYATAVGIVVHEVTIEDGASAPMCTQAALRDHIGELATAKDGNFEVDVKFNLPCDAFSRDKYNAFRDQLEADPDDEYANIQINYPWDRR